ncbi:methyltransferase domain-containing protein [Mariniblastus fucicola]|uniref:Putative methyltransferase YcgJ n=1 Tax=Mariniblastus fucicola TaxID=980251 RepID=A0A5B9PHP6_9BACT|nr:methyltransferase domain-containing protein [Mariniblastus fucicola]QEG22401.1 putative methyltransferase YcgJ [Mariniblastus fucicola]
MKKICFLIVAINFLIVAPLVLNGQEASVRPGINDSFNKLSAEELSTFVERFESEGREIYDLRQEIVNACRLRPAMVVADIGAGTGLFSRMMAPNVAELFAVDINQKFLDHVKATCKDDGCENVKAVLCDQTSCGLDENSVDLVFVCDTYHHFEFPYKTMRSIQKALKPDGMLVLVEFDRVEGESSDWILNHVRADRDTFSKEIELAGFEEVELIDDIFKTSYLKRYKVSDRKTAKGHTTDTLDDVRKGLKDGTAVLIDVREEREWDGVHLSDATLVPLSKLRSGEEEKSKLVATLPKGKIVYAHCLSGGRVLAAAKSLEDVEIDFRPLPQGIQELVDEGFEKAK